MKRLAFRPLALLGLTVPTLAGGLLLSSCNSQPKATEVDKTATVIPKEATKASDTAATTVSADSAKAVADSMKSRK